MLKTILVRCGGTMLCSSKDASFGERQEKMVWCRLTEVRVFAVERGTMEHQTHGYQIATMARTLIRIGTTITVPGARRP